MNEANGAAESAATKPGESSAPVVSGFQTLEEFSAFMRDLEKQSSGRGDESPENDDGEQSPAPRSKSKPKNLEALAEALELEVKDLYDVEIPSSRDGEKPYRLGALKDLAKDTDELAIRTLRLDEDRKSFERERVTAEQELREMLSHLPESALKPDAVKKMRAQLEKKHARERELVLEHIPEWSNAETRATDLAAIAEHLKGYDIPETFLLANFDHGVMRYVRDNMRRETMVRKALELVEERKTKTPPRSSKGEKPAPSNRTERAPNAHLDTRTRSAVNDFMGTIAAAAAAKRKQ